MSLYKVGSVLLADKETGTETLSEVAKFTQP